MIKGIPELIQSLRKMGKDVEGATARAITESLLHLDRHIKQNIQHGGRSGIIYKRGKNITHQASAPGEYPKTDTGELISRANFKLGIIERNRNRVRGEIGSAAPHAKYLEYKPAASGGRPWLSRALREQKKAIENIIINRLTKEIEK